MEESKLQDLINNDRDVQKSIMLALGNNSERFSFKKEDQFPNGVYVDFTVKDSNKVAFILELKGDEINVTEYIRGIGQIYEYQHFIDSNMSVQNYEFNDDACSVFCFPSKLIRNKDYNIGLFKYPEKSKILEFNENNKSVRLITKDELKKMAESVLDTQKVSISQYYIRDNRLFELYICLRYLAWRKLLGDKTISRKYAEDRFLKKINTINNGNWRNVFISLSSLGLIDNNNFPTPTGNVYATGSYEDFCYSMYISYIKEYIDLVMNVLIDIKESNGDNSESIHAQYKEISDRINSMFNGKKVLYVTDSGNRYLSSWLNIMRDDFRCIDFESGKSERKLLYNIGEMNENTIKRRISNNSLAYKYINRFTDLMNGRD